MEMDDTSAVDPVGRCCLCHRFLSSNIDTIGDLEAMSICGDCKFIFFEDSGTTQTRFNNNLESIDNMLSQQFPDMQPTISDRVNQSRQRRRVLSDTESKDYDSVLGDGDILSYAAYASNSDASVDVVTFLDNDDVSAHPHDDGDGDDDDDDDEFEEVENTVGSVVGGIQLHRSLATNGRNLPSDWLSEILSDEGIRNSERRRLFGILEEEELETSGYVDAETNDSRLGASPAAVWFVKNLERVVVDETGLVCVICKDSVFVGSVVNRLPCGHVYHPSCIIPWLNARSTCPLCRYELPTDDQDKWHQETQEPGSSSESGRGRWWLVAAPLVSVMGIGVVLWLGGVVFGGQRDDRSSSSRRWWLLL